jgi:hypothetical protein
MRRDVLLTAGAAATALVITAPHGFSARYLTVEEAQRLCFPEAAAFEPMKASPGPATRGWVVRGKSGVAGHLYFDRVIGKHLLIDYVVALGPDGKVRQIEILEYRESYGGEVRRPSWRKQFAGLSAADPPRHQHNVMNIGGATLSSRNLTQGVARLLTWHARHAGG